MSLSKLLVSIFFSFNLFILPTLASPWAGPGDSQLRSDIEILSQFGLVSGPVNNWPISWKQITSNLYKADSMVLPAYVQMAMNRVKKKIPAELNAKAKASYTNDIEFFRGFEKTGRSKLELESSVEYNLDQTSIRLNARYGDDEELNLDGSYVSQEIGNWSTYVGAVNRWWGPGRETTTLMSTNARPMPSFGVRRVNPKPFHTKWLSWIGPWQWDLFISKMDEDRIISSPIFIGMKLSFEPVKNFEVGLARTLMMCGEGRICNFKTWTQGLIGFGDLDNIGTVETQPGNQLAQIDLSYAFSWNDSVNLKLYAEGTAEDLVVVLPYTYSRIVGASFYGPFGNNGNNWRLTAEYSDSTGSLAWLYGEHRQGIMYNHHIYRTGYRYYDKVIGHTLDSDSKYFSLKATIINMDGWEASLKYQNILINSENRIAGNQRNRLSLNRERINSFTANLKLNTNFGNFQIDGRVMDNNINTPFENKVTFKTGLSWEIGF